MDTWESAIGKDEFQYIIADWRETVDPDLDIHLEEFLGEILDWAIENPKHSSVVEKADELLQENLIKKIIPLIEDELSLKIPNDFAFLEKCSF